jgi:hypothetical protein
MQSGTWEFSVQRGGSKRLEDGVRFEPSLNYTREVTPLNGPQWVWLVYWPDPTLPRVWVDPVKRGVGTPAEVEAYIDAKWPPPGPPQAAQATPAQESTRA